MIRMVDFEFNGRQYRAEVYFDVVTVLMSTDADGNKPEWVEQIENMFIHHITNGDGQYCSITPELESAVGRELEVWGVSV